MVSNATFHNIVEPHIIGLYVSHVSFYSFIFQLQSLNLIKSCLFFQAKEFGRKAVVASEGHPDDTLSRTIVEFMKILDSQRAI